MSREEPDPRITEEQRRAFEGWIASMASLPDASLTLGHTDKAGHDELQREISRSAAAICRLLPAGQSISIRIHRRRGPKPEADRDQTAARVAGTYGYFLNLLREHEANFPTGGLSEQIAEEAAQRLDAVLRAPVVQHGFARSGGGLDQETWQVSPTPRPRRSAAVSERRCRDHVGCHARRSICPTICRKRCLVK